MEPICHLRTDKTWIISEARRWCRRRFLAEVIRRDEARTQAAS
jgi:hypothetical protein